MPRPTAITAGGGTGTCAPRSATSPRCESGASTEAGHEVLDATSARDEALLLAVRTRAGVEVPPGKEAVVEELVADGLVEPGRDRLVLTRRGRLLASAVTVRLLTALAERGSGAPLDLRGEVAVGRLDC